MKVLIVDDEPLAVARLQKQLQSIEGFECAATASDGREALDIIRELKPDIVLSDIRMPDIDGIGLVEQAAQLSGKIPIFIFTTAYEEHALQAYDLQVIGYLLKPVNAEKLKQALHQAEQLAEAKQKSETQRQYLTASLRGNIELIPIENIRVLYAEHKYVTVHHTFGEALLDMSLKSLEEEFPHYFKRVHRSALVAEKYVEGLEKAADGQYHLKLQGVDFKPLVSRRMIADVRQWLKEL